MPTNPYLPIKDETFKVGRGSAKHHCEYCLSRDEVIGPHLSVLERRFRVRIKNKESRMNESESRVSQFSPSPRIDRITNNRVTE